MTEMHKGTLTREQLQFGAKLCSMALEKHGIEVCIQTGDLLAALERFTPIEEKTVFKAKRKADADLDALIATKNVLKKVVRKTRKKG